MTEITRGSGNVFVDLGISKESAMEFAKKKYSEAIKQKDSSMQLYWQGVVECLDGSIWGKDNVAE